ncbi:MAG TPA: S53 family peptidase [Jatrophihabitans sp.]|jgi:subtilase family serine protease
MYWSPTRRTRRGLIGVLATIGATCAALVLAPQAIGAAPHADRHVLPGSSPKWLHSGKQLGATPTNSRIGFGILLGLRDQSAAEAQIQQLSDPSSASYGQWLTNDQFNAKYAPSSTDVDAVKSWLKGQGFSLGTSYQSGLFVPASGTAAQVEKTFGTSLANYSVDGVTVHTNTGVLSLPSDAPTAVVSAVKGVIGVDQGEELKVPSDTEPGPPAGSRYGVQPCSSYFGQKLATDKPSAYGKKQPYAVCGYTPSQLQSAYGLSSSINSGKDGSGVTVAITDAYAAPTILADAQQYNRVHNQPQFKSGQFRQIVPGSNDYDLVNECGASGWYGEETLDVEAVHATAPGAKVVYVGAPDCSTGLDDAWASTIDNHVADIITNSWTDGIDDVADLGTDYIAFYQEFSTEAALTGITVQFSAGDSGDHTSGGTDLASKTAEFPADLPYATGIGGTSVEIGNRGQWVGEYGWQSAYSQPLSGTSWSALPGNYSSGGGGGTSQLFAQPFYQKGYVPKSVSQYYGSTPMRAVPDISMPGDPNTGMIVGQTQVFPDGTYWDQYRIGGTSLSSPLMAGVLAVAEGASRHPLGFVNPLYYSLVGSKAVHDIVAPSKPVAQVRTDFTNLLDPSGGYTFKLQTIDVQSSTLHDTHGWDDETGVGTPNGQQFLQGLAAAAGGGRRH